MCVCGGGPLVCRRCRAAIALRHRRICYVLLECVSHVLFQGRIRDIPGRMYERLLNTCYTRGLLYTWIAIHVLFLGLPYMREAVRSARSSDGWK